MSDDATPDSAPAASGKTKLLTVADLDQRTSAAKSARALIGALHDDLGGEDRLSAAERVLVQRAAIAAAMCEHAEVRWLSGHNVDLAGYCTLVNSARRLFADLGLERRPRDVTPDLQRYIAAKAEPTPEDAASDT
jgi:hypothetical protein